MGSTYTRQSTFTDGDTITADLFNTEFDQLVAAFAATSGHSHDGTAGEGGPIGGLITPGITLGDNTIDVTLTFDGGSNDGVLKWMEDEDYFEFSDDILIASTEKLQFRDTAIYINSSADGQLDLVADTEIQIAATTIDINGNADISGNLGIGGNLTVTGTTTFNGGTITLGDAAADNVVFGADVDSSIIPDDDDTYDLGSSSQQWRNLYIDGTAEIDTLAINGTTVTATAAELNILDGVTSTAAELNILDGVTSTAAELNILDGVTSTAAELNILDGVTSTASELNYSDTGASVGTVVASKVVTVDSNKDVASFRNITLTGELDAGSLDISGNADIDGTLETDALSLNGTTVTATAAELNILDGKAFLDEDNFASNSATGIASQQSIKAYVDGVTTTSITSTGALNAGSITSGFGSIDNGSSTITTTGLISGGSLDIDDVLINGTTIGHTDDTDLITLANGVVTVAGEVSMTTLDIGGTNVTSTAAELNALDGITAVVGELNALDLGSTAVGTAIASKAVVLDSNKDYTGIRNFTITGNLSVGGTTTVVDTVTMNAQNAVLFEGATADAHETTLTIVDPTADRTINLPNQSGTVPVLAAASNTAITSTPEELNILDGVTSTAAELNILDASNSTLGDLSEISTVANDDVFLAIDTSGGGLKKITRSTVVSGLATSSGLSNVVEDTTPQLGGNLDMNGADIVTTSNATIDLAPNGTGTVVVRGNTNSGAIVFNCESNSHGQKVYGQPHSAGVTNTLMLPAGADSTLVSLVSTDTLTNKTLTSPKINEDVAVTSTATELNLLDGVTATTAELNILDGVTSTAAELNALDGITAVVGELNALDLGSTAVGTAIASKAMVLDSNKDYTGVRNFTITGELDAGSLDISGNADIDGTLEADAITVNGTALATVIAGTTVTNATNSAHVLVTDNESTNEENLIAFVEGATSSTGNVGLEMDGNLSYNPSTGTVSATIFKGNIDAVDGDFDGTLEADAISIGGTTITSTAAELNVLDGITAVVGELNALDLGSTAVGTAIASKAMILDSNKDYTGVRNFTLSGELDAGSIDVSGNVDVDGTLETDALSINGTTVTSTAAELNILDGVTSTAAELNILDGVTTTAAEINLIDGGTARGTTAVADGDGVLINDAGTMRMTSVDTLSTYMSGKSVGGSNIVTTGALNSGSITSGFGNIDTGSSTITTTGLISGGSLDIDNVLINGTTIGHTDDTDLITLANGVVTVAGEVQMTTLDIGGTNVTATAAELNVLDGITAVVGELNALDIGSTAVGTAVASKAMILDSNKDYTGVRNFTLSGELDAGSLDISGNVDIDGTLETDALSINGTTVTSTAAELNILDGVTSNATELNVLDALDRGSLIYGNSSGATAVLGQGSANQVLTSDGTDISWADAAGGPAYTRSATVPSSPNAGDWWFNTSYGVLYIYDATDGWITNQDRTLGKGLLVASGTYSLLVNNNDKIYTARFEPEDKMLVDPASATHTHTYTSTAQTGVAAVSNATRGVFTQNSSQTSNAYGYVTIATRGAASDFGDSVEILDGAVGCDHATRGVFLENKSNGSNGLDMEYITIATAGNGTNFGDLSVNRWYMGNHAIANTTRGVWTGGYNAGSQNVMDYITIASTGNATDFGNLTVAGWRTETAHSIVRGLIFGGNNRTNTIDYITIASTGNATDFGDHFNSNSPTSGFCVHNKTYAYYSKASLNDREKHTIATAANATSFAWTNLDSLGETHTNDAIKGWISASG